MPDRRVPFMITAVVLMALIGVTSITLSSRNVSDQRSRASETTQAAVYATNCNWYVSPAGNDANDGRTTSTPKTLRGGSGVAHAGDTVCLLDGTYNLTSSFQPSTYGSSTGFITYIGYTRWGATLRWNSSNYDDLVHYIGSQNSPRDLYWEFNNLVFDGNNFTGGNGILILYGYHVNVKNSYFKNLGTAGFGTVGSDYDLADHNMVWNSGYNHGWSSGLSLDENVWEDRGAGFHSFFTNNIIAGEYDNSTYHSDGNGIIMDSGGSGLRDAPPTLIANNVIYQNGGRCISLFQEGYHWVVNNTCYKNAQDTQVSHGLGNSAEVTLNQAPHSVIVNNITNAWSIQHNWQDFGDSPYTVYSHNMYYQGGPNQLPSGVIIQQANPLFVHPIYTTDPPESQQDYRHSIDPMQLAALGYSFQLQQGSPAIDDGVDPTTLTTDPAIIAGLQQYVRADMNGVSRPQGATYDLGAYEYTVGVPTPTVAPSSAPTVTPKATATPYPTATPIVLPTSTPTPTGTQTDTFDDMNPYPGDDKPIKGQYLTGYIDWSITSSTGQFKVSPPWGLFKTHSIYFRNSGQKQGSFRLLNNHVLLGFTIYNGGNSTTVSVGCTGNPSVSVSVSAGQLVQFATGWQAPCTSVVTLKTNNSQQVNFDDLILR